ncbi:MAG: nuclear transport factor 2 family protein [Albidovulum sp.]|uniref:nuclear transport factor 2 family protein n=1 Tax=Albidovulum sp. TaxID=1872424 RepID=UPI003CAB3105
MTRMMTAAVAFAGLATATLAAEPLDSNKALAVGLLEKGLIGGDADYIRANVAEDYIQHNPLVADGRDGLLGFVEFVGTIDPKVTSTIHRVIAEGDLVVVHSEVDFYGPKSILDLFRIEDGKIAEHWDVIQEVPAETASGRTMFDGATEIADLDKTAENKALVTGFVSDVLMGGKLDRIDDYLAPEYMQHNPFVPDTRDGLKGFIDYIAANEITFYYSALHTVVAEGNFVFTQSEGVYDGKPTAFFDLWRVEGGKLVEHWDAVQEVPAEFAHENGMF